MRYFDSKSADDAGGECWLMGLLVDGCCLASFIVWYIVATQVGYKLYGFFLAANFGILS